MANKLNKKALMSASMFFFLVSFVQTLTCPAGKWGTNCAFPCRTTCKAASCYPENGQCTIGCEAGYIGEMCENPCPPGRFGTECHESCVKHCPHSVCNHIDGKCIEGNSCNPGFTGAGCDIPCSDGKFGYNCLQTCITCLENVCAITDGLCLKGCKPGYLGSFCDSDCIQGFWGEGCFANCPRNCFNNTCSKDFGHCFKCKEGLEVELGSHKDCTKSIKHSWTSYYIGASVLAFLILASGLFIICIHNNKSYRLRKSFKHTRKTTALQEEVSKLKARATALVEQVSLGGDVDALAYRGSNASSSSSF